MAGNIGSVERVLRFFTGVALISSSLTGAVRGGWRVALPALGGLWAWEGLSGYCFLYDLLGIGSYEEEG